MLRSVSIVLGLLVLAEALVGVLDLPIPGAALGLAVIATMFKTAGEPDPNLARIFDGIAPHVPLLFVPAAVGVVAHLDSVSSFWPHFAAAILLGTAATLVVTGLCATAVLRLLQGAPAS